MTRYLLLGAHLRRDDVVAEGVTPLAAGDLTVSAIGIGARDNLADRAIVARAARTRQELARREIFVAIRYGATAADETGAARKLAPHLESWKALLERWRGHAELTLRIGGGARAARPDRKDFSSGAGYLRALQSMRQVAPETAAFARRAEERVREIASELRVVDREDGGIEIAILVRRDAIGRAREAAESLKDERASIPFLLSGPWPLEVFADEQR